MIMMTTRMRSTTRNTTFDSVLLLMQRHRKRQSLIVAVRTDGIASFSDMTKTAATSRSRSMACRHRTINHYPDNNKVNTKIRPLSTATVSAATTATTAATATESSPSSEFPSFDSIEELHPITKMALQSMKIGNMTEIQYKTFYATIDGTNDVIGRSRTGSGKTLAFLIPALERILRHINESSTGNTGNIGNTGNSQQHDGGDDNDSVKMLIISPTRELAHQIYTASVMLTNKFGKPTTYRGSAGSGASNSASSSDQSNSNGNSNSSSPAIHCQVMYGGTPKTADINKMQHHIPTILTTTPGRLLDHLKSSYIPSKGNNGSKSFVDYVKNVNILVLDEMDLLLDMGFRDDIQSILGFLKSSSKRNSNLQQQQQQQQQHSRQTLLFSATLPHGVKDVIRKYIRKEHVIVDCIQDNDPTSHTVSTVDQSHVILPPDKMIAGVIQTIFELMKRNRNHKIIVFFPTTSQVTYFSQVFNIGLGRRVIEIHSGISQGARTNRSDNFRHSKTACILFTSDVSARGVDYPNVTHVVQVGAPSNRETYIHRLGRTGRAGKSGQGILLLLPDEVDFIRRDLGDINIPMNGPLQGIVKLDINDDVENDMANHMKRIHEMLHRSNDMKNAAQDVYRSLFGYYAQRFKNMHVHNFEESIINLVNGFAKQAGMQEMPMLSSKVASQYRLAQHPALNVQRQWDAGSRNFDVGRRNTGGGQQQQYQRGGRGGGKIQFNVGSSTGRRGTGSFFGRTGRGPNVQQPLDTTKSDTSPLPSTTTNTDWHGYV